ncbi:MAG: prolipoprotein diacylglyceryl transferase [Patescibacteria group bacterium]|nr:prolipoprotein diacylglyceryl transferase [Patescibacteria group bacterium]
MPEKFNPVAFHLGPVAVSRYGIMYVVAFGIVYYLVRYRVRTEKLGISFEAVQEFFPWGILGLLIGARLGDVFIYDWSYFKNHLSQIFLPFDIYNHWHYIGIYGMSYFGGLVGLAAAFVIFSFLRLNLKKQGFGKMLEFSDLFAPAVPLAFAFGRLGNFINGELWGRVTTVPWGMYFPQDFSGQLRHPSQLYEMFLEGILLFVILWSLRKFKFSTGYLTAFYLIGYGLARFAAEFFREPDNGWFFWSLTIGQWFSVIIIFFGISIMIQKKNEISSA